MAASHARLPQYIRQPSDADMVADGHIYRKSNINRNHSSLFSLICIQTSKFSCPFFWHFRSRCAHSDNRKSTDIPPLPDPSADHLYEQSDAHVISVNVQYHNRVRYRHGKLDNRTSFVW